MYIEENKKMKRIEIIVTYIRKEKEYHICKKI